MRIAQQERNDYGARDAREERGGRRAGHAHIEHIDQKCVAAHIDGVHRSRISIEVLESPIERKRAAPAL